MKISIDTKEDSVQDIKRLINMLQNFVNHNQSPNSSSDFVDIFGSNTSSTSEPQPSPTDSNGLFSMFGGNDTSSTPTVETPEEPKPQARIKVIEY